MRVTLLCKISYSNKWGLLKALFKNSKKKPQNLQFFRQFKNCHIFLDYLWHSIRFYKTDRVLLFVSVPRVWEKRAVSSSSSSSSTSTELCDDPSSDCCSQKSADDNCDINRIIIGDEGGDRGHVVIDRCRSEVNVDDDDVSLAEMLRANSEVLNRMCKGDCDDVLPVTQETNEARSADLGERLPDLINDIDALGESLQASAETSDRLSDSCVQDKPAPVAECPVEEQGRPEDDSAVQPSKPFAPFPSKVRQPKRLGIELGLYPDG